MQRQKQNAKSIWCTDGSKQFYCSYTAAKGNSHSIDPRGPGATTNIIRAVLAGIAAALLLLSEEEDKIIATGSQTSICTINKIWTLPESGSSATTRSCWKIVARLLARARKDLQSRMLKVKSRDEPRR